MDYTNAPTNPPTIPTTSNNTIHATTDQFFLAINQYNPQVNPKGINLGKILSITLWITIGDSPLAICHATVVEPMLAIKAPTTKIPNKVAA